MISIRARGILWKWDCLIKNMLFYSNLETVLLDQVWKNFFFTKLMNLVACKSVRFYWAFFVVLGAMIVLYFKRNKEFWITNRTLLRNSKHWPNHSLNIYSFIKLAIFLQFLSNWVTFHRNFEEWLVKNNNSSIDP